MTYRRSRREIAFANSMVSRLEIPNKVAKHIKCWHPAGPWSVAVYAPDTRKLIDRRYFGVDEFSLLEKWLCQLQPEFDCIQWFVVSGKDAKQ